MSLKELKSFLREDEEDMMITLILDLRRTLYFNQKFSTFKKINERNIRKIHMKNLVNGNYILSIIINLSIKPIKLPR
jgi:hypothetical protein